MTTDLNGILIVDKTKGMTSHDVVQMVRSNFLVKKVGHAGTLDPNATGVLVLLLGSATKLSNKFLNDDKEYIATMKLGQRTTTGDCEGNVIYSKEISVSQELIKDVINKFIGEIEQIPPMFSAKKVNGKRLYKLARKGIEVNRQPQKINIKEIDIEEINLPFVRFRIVCSKGTYIRQLVDDIGERLGCGAHLVELERTRSGAFLLKNAIKLSKGLNNIGKLSESLIRL